MYGRTWVCHFLSALNFLLIHLEVLHIGNIFSVAFSLGCAFAPNAPTFIAFRFLCRLASLDRSLLSLNIMQRVSLEVLPLLVVLDQSAIASHLATAHQPWRYTVSVLSLVR